MRNYHKISNCLLRRKENIFTGLPTKDETVKTTQNSKNMTILSLLFGFCSQLSILMVSGIRGGGQSIQFSSPPPSVWLWIIIYNLDHPHISSAPWWHLPHWLPWMELDTQGLPRSSWIIYEETPNMPQTPCMYQEVLFYALKAIARPYSAQGINQFTNWIKKMMVFTTDGHRFSP